MNRDGTPRFPLRHGRDSERFLLQVCDQPITCSCLDQSGFVGGTLHDRTVIAVQIHSVCDLQAHQRGDLFLIHRGQKRYSGIIVLRLVKASDHDQISLSAVSLRYLCHFSDISAAADRVHTNHGLPTGCEKCAELPLCCGSVVH